MADYPFTWPPPEWEWAQEPPLSGETSYAGAGIPLPQPSPPVEIAFPPEEITGYLPPDMLTSPEESFIPLEESVISPEVTSSVGLPTFDASDAVSAAGGVPGMIPQEQPSAPQSPYDLAVQAVREREAATVQANETLGREQSYAADILAFRRAQNEKALAEVMAESKVRRAKLEALAVEQSKLSIDPDRLVKNQGVWGGIANGLMIALGGLGRRATGGRNIGYDMIQQEIERDIDAQKADIVNKRDVLGKQMTMYEQNLRAGMDEYTAKALAADSIYDAAMKKLEAQKLLMDSPFAAAKADAEIAALGQARTDHREKFDQQQLENDFRARQQTEAERSNRAGEGVAWYNARTSRLGLEEQRRHNEAVEGAAAKAKGVDPKRMLANTGDPRGFGLDPAGVTELTGEAEMVTATRKEKLGLENYIAANYHIMELRQKYPGHLWNNWLKTSAGKQMIESVASDLVLGYAQLNGQGALTEAERIAYFKRKVGDVGDWVAKNSTPLWLDQIEQAEARYNRVMHIVSPNWGSWGYNVAFNPQTGHWEKPLDTEAEGPPVSVQPGERRLTPEEALHVKALESLVVDKRLVARVNPADLAIIAKGMTGMPGDDFKWAGAVDRVRDALGGQFISGSELNQAISSLRPHRFK